MKTQYIIIPFLLLSMIGKAQVTWSDDVAEVVYNNCASCHNPNGIAPFSLMTYQEAYDYRLAISPAVANGNMPPWTADTSYQRYAHERILTSSEKNAILDWVAQGAPEGNPSNTPPQPVFANEGFLTQTPDLVIDAPVYTSKANFIHDDYVCFSIPTGLTTTKKLRAFEIIPGNTSIVHHALVFTDPAGTYPSDTTNGDCNGPTTGLLGGYTPGALPTVFPGQGNINMGYTLDAGSNIVLAMHYPAGSAGMKDSTKVRLYFYDDAVTIREITSLPAINRIDGSGGFTILANTVDTLYQDQNSAPFDVSVLSVFPHMHLIGKSIEAYATNTSSNDTIKFARINEWDFDWQEFLFFKKPKKLPANSTIHGRAIYDNTSNNHHNPNDPPIDINGGFNTTDEMFIVYFHFLLYQNGDENLDLDSLTQDFYSVEVAEYNKTSSVKVYPNPFSSETTLSLDVRKSGITSLYIYDMRGQLVTKLLDREPMTVGENKVVWNGKDTENKEVSPGIYFYSVVQDGVQSSGKLVYTGY
jgi:hypothetical protein